MTKVFYSCQKDAKKALEKFEKSNLAIEISDTEIKNMSQYEKKGRPSKDAKPSHYHYFIHGVAKASSAYFEAQAATKCRFILATNHLDTDKLPDDQLLAEFKKLVKVERGFRFLKDPQFAASTFFVKKPERIEALLFIMTLCLSVYTAIEYRVRSQLSKENETIPNQVNKHVKNPTARWLFILMTGIHVLYQGHAKPLILNLDDTKTKIINLMGEQAKKYYFRI